MIKLNKWNNQKHKLTFNEELHKYYWDGKEIKGSVSSVINSISPYKDMEIDPAVLEAAGIRGTMVHKWIEDHINEVPIEQRKLIESYRPYINAFLEWEKEWGPRFKILHSELQLYSIQDGYAGTIDAIVYDNQLNEYGILDFKTNSVKIDEVVQAQTSGYARLLNQWSEESHIEKAFVLYLSKDSTFTFKPINLKEGYKVFEECLINWHKEERND